jgi:hypothetical protein
MTDVRYSVPGVPPAPAAGITAFVPHFNRMAASGAQSYKYAVHGSPGTEAIPMTARVNTQISPDYGDLAQAGPARSSDAPDAIWPQLYYQSFIAEPAQSAPLTGPRYYSPQQPGLTTLLPVPAEDGRALYQAKSARLAYRAVLNRVKQLPWFPKLYTAPDSQGAGNAPRFWGMGDSP